jgi:hypothetical protein
MKKRFVNTERFFLVAKAHKRIFAVQTSRSRAAVARRAHNP